MTKLDNIQSELVFMRVILAVMAIGLILFAIITVNVKDEVAKQAAAPDPFKGLHKECFKPAVVPRHEQKPNNYCDVYIKSERRDDNILVTTNIDPQCQDKIVGEAISYAIPTAGITHIKVPYNYTMHDWNETVCLQYVWVEDNISAMIDAGVIGLAVPVHDYDFTFYYS